MDEDQDCFPGVDVGTTVTYARTVSESDVYLFAGITGDHSPNHTDAEYMRDTPFGQRIAHGALTLGLMSTCSTRLIEQMGNTPTVNYGYDKVRFTGPVFFGDTVTVSYVVAQLDRRSGRLHADVKATNQRGDLVAVAVNVLRTVDR
jgi:3-hydroxybutyryl-CoA dehydratase